MKRFDFKCRRRKKKFPWWNGKGSMKHEAYLNLKRAKL